MELGQRLKELRNKNNITQEEFADKLYVSRQTISNWENDKSYPDIHSLLMISELFKISLDDLVKGDIEIMEEKINKSVIGSFKKDNNIYGVLLIICLLTAIPMSRFFGIVGDIIWLIVFAITIYYGIRIEKVKKEYDIYTYKEIVAFTKGEKLDAIEKAREEGKRKYQIIILLLGSGLIGIIIAHIIYTILGNLSLI